jgi:predicted transcriptional regulator
MTEPKPPGLEETPAIFDAELEPAPPLSDEEEAALLEAEADADAGRVVPHAEVAKWMQTIIDGNPQPMPKAWLE